MTLAAEDRTQPVDADRRDLLAGAFAITLLANTQALAAPRRSNLKAAIPMTRCCPIIELRQYTLHAGQRDPLIELFNREFIETQEAVGIRVIGQFRDLDDPNRFVWLRGFENMEMRGRALAAFYGGPAWKANRTAANATMIDSDNVLLLHPTDQATGFDLAARSRGATASDSRFMAAVHYLDADALPAFANFFEKEMRSRIEIAGASILATLATEAAPNSFPHLPIREGERVFVWFARFEDSRAFEQYGARLQRADDWREAASPELLRQFMRKPEVLRLAPTSRSLLS